MAMPLDPAHMAIGSVPSFAQGEEKRRKNIVNARTAVEDVSKEFADSLLELRTDVDAYVKTLGGFGSPEAAQQFSDAMDEKLQKGVFILTDKRAAYGLQEGAGTKRDAAIETNVGDLVQIYNARQAAYLEGVKALNELKPDVLNACEACSTQLQGIEKAFGGIKADTPNAQKRITELQSQASSAILALEEVYNQYLQCAGSAYEAQKSWLSLVEPWPEQCRGKVYISTDPNYRDSNAKPVMLTPTHDSRENPFKGLKALDENDGFIERARAAGVVTARPLVAYSHPLTWCVFASKGIPVLGNVSAGIRNERSEHDLFKTGQLVDPAGYAPANPFNPPKSVQEAAHATLGEVRDNLKAVEEKAGNAFQHYHTLTQGRVGGS